MLIVTMKIALVHEFLTKLGGAERVVRTLSEMFPDAPIHTLLYDEGKTSAWFPPEKVVTSPLQKKYRWIKRPQPLLPYMKRAIESFDFSGYDLVISSSSAFAHGIVVPVNTTHICYCHSPMRYAWDYSAQYRKDKGIGIFGSLKNWLISKHLHPIRQWDFWAGDRPDHYIAASKHVQKRITKYYKQPSKVIYPPVDLDRFEVSYENDGFFLIVAALTPWKKIDLAVEAFTELGKPLVIIGDGLHKRYLEKIAGPNIHFMGRQSDEVVVEHLKNCRAFIFPSEDDFGIAPIEAMACGKPVIAYQKGGALETVKSGVTGVFFPEQTKESLLEGISNFLDMDIQEQFDPDAIAEHAKQFEKDRFIKEIWNFVEAS